MSETRPPLPYDWKKTVKAGLKRAVLTLGAVALAAVVQALQDPAVVGKVAGSGKLGLALVPVIVGLASAIANWSKNKDR